MSGWGRQHADMTFSLVSFVELTSRQKRNTYSSAHLDKRSKQHHLSSNLRFDLQSPKSALPLFSKTARSRVLFTPQWYLNNHGLSKEACLCAGAEWLRSFVSQRVARGQSSVLPPDKQTLYRRSGMEVEDRPTEHRRLPTNHNRRQLG